MTIEGWHFTGATLRDGRPIPAPGVWLAHDGPIIPCESGLHASERVLDALTFAPGGTLHRVTVRGDVLRHEGDKVVGRERRIEWTLDESVMSPLLRAFARRCALDVIHLWDAPLVVRQYLETGDETLRAAARGAARNAARNAATVAARDAARNAARDAARGAASYAAKDAAWAIAWDAARDVARNAAWDAAWAAARGVARNAATVAAKDAAWAIAGAAAKDAAWAIAGADQDAILTDMVMAARAAMGSEP